MATIAICVDYLGPGILEVSVEKKGELHPIEHVLEQLSSNICGAETFLPDELGAWSSSAGMGSSLSCSTSRKPRMMADVNRTWGFGARMKLLETPNVYLHLLVGPDHRPDFFEH